MNCKLFADDTPLFSELNSDLVKISEWGFKWKMSFNPDPPKPAQEVIFSRELITVLHPSITFNSNPLNLRPVTNIWEWF